MILSFDTSEKKTTVAIVEGERVVFEIDSPRWFERLPQQHNDVKNELRMAGQSTAIVAMIESMFQQTKIQPDHLSAIAISNGPGNFTGLRVGIVVARMLCYAWTKPLIAVDSLEVAAAKLCRARRLDEGNEIWAAVNGQRKQVFTAKFRVRRKDSNADEFRLDVVHSQRLLDHTIWLERIQKADQVTGSGAMILNSQIAPKIDSMLPTAELACCDALGIAALATPRLIEKRFDDVWTVTPVYFRPSAAEEVRSAAQQ